MWPIAITSLSRAPISPSISIRSSVPVADGTQAEQQPAAGPAYAVHDLQQRLETGLVVGEVHDHGDARWGSEKKFIRPGLCSASGRKRAQPLDHHLPRDAERQRGRRGGEAVLDVEAGQPGERHRHVDQLDQRVGVAVGQQHRDPAVDDRGGPAAGRQHLADGGRVGVAGEDPGLRPDRRRASRRPAGRRRSAPPSRPCG